jgi:catechol 2,3-dioxygenase-like lactoylglutathione lyase family enzyme
VAQRIQTVEHYHEKGIPMKTSRIAQVTIVANDLAKSIAFYRDAFDALYHEEISSFQFGTYPDDDFFSLRLPTRTAIRGPAARPSSVCS